MKKHVLVLVAVAAITAMILGGCGTPPTAPPATPPTAPPAAPPAQEEPVKLGALTWMSGPMIDIGQQQQEGLELGVKQINDAGGILGGREVELLKYDVGYTTEEAMAALKTAVEHGCVGICGPGDATLATALQPTLESYQMPCICDGGAQEMLEGSYWGWARSSAPGPALTRATARWIEDQGFKRVVYLGLDSKWCMECHGWLTDIWGRPDSGTELLDVIMVPWTQADLSLEVAKAVGENPDFIYLCVWGKPALMSAITKMHELDYKGSWTVTHNCMTPDVVEAAGALANGSWHLWSWLHDPSVPENEAFYQAFKAMFGREPTGWSEDSYEKAIVMCKAFDIAGTTDDLKKFGDALREVDWVTPRGNKYEILPDGQFFTPYWTFAQLQDGEWTNLEELPFLREDYLITD